MGQPAARVTDKVQHPLPGMLMPGPGSLNVLTGGIPSWRGLPALAAMALQAAKAVANVVEKTAEAATLAAAGTPGAPAAVLAEKVAKTAAALAMSTLMNSLAAASAALTGGTPDKHLCLPPPLPPHGLGMVIDGSSSVLVNGLPFCAKGDHLLETLGPPDEIMMGCPTVFVGKGAGGGLAAMLDLVSSLIAKAVAAVKNVVEAVKNVVNFVKSLVNSVIDGILAVALKFGQAIVDAAVKALAFLRDEFEKAVDAQTSGKNPGAVFDSPDEAARAALNAANPQSIKDNLEYGGMIYKDPATGKFGYTGPAKGTDAGFNPSDAPVPPGTAAAGDYHTHADYSQKDPKTGKAVRTSDPKKDDYNSDNFSQTDRNGITSDAKGKPGYKGYLGTPSGTFKQFDPATGKTTTL